MWKKQSCSEHQCMGLLEEHCSNYIMSMLNLQQIHQWASSQHQCGIKQNKLSASQSGLLSCLDEWQHLYVHLSTCVGYIYIPGYACMSLWFSRHIWIHACASLWIKSGFPDLPFQDGHKLVVCTDSVTCSCSYKWGVHRWFWVCSSAASSFIRKYFSQHFSIKGTQTWHMYFFYGTNRLSLKEESVWLLSIAICIK